MKTLRRETAGALAPLVQRAFWTALVAISAVALLAAALVVEQRRAAAWVYHSRDVARLGRQALTLAVDQESAVRGVLLTGRDTVGVLARLTDDELPTKLDTLARLTSDNPAQQRRARAIAAAVRDWNARVAIPALGGPAPAGGALGPEGEAAAFARVRETVREFLGVEEALYDRRRRRADATQWLVLVTIVGGLGVVAAMLARLRRGLIHQAGALDEQQHQLEEQAVELEAQTAELEATNLELAESNAQLEAAVSEATRVNGELEALTYTMAHDLRAPLRALDGYAYMLGLDQAERLDEAARQHLAKLRAASQRMARLIDELLALAKLGRGTVAHDPVDLGALARTALEDLRRAEPARDVEARVAEGMVVEGDPTLLGLVMQNLVGNAWKFTSGRAQAHIEVGIASRDGEAAYFVRDDGVGFDMTYADTLFGAFQRLHGTEFEGTGIGLAIVQRIVLRHGGRVWAESAPGRGATFYFTIPTGLAAR